MSRRTQNKKKYQLPLADEKSSTEAQQMLEKEEQCVCSPGTLYLCGTWGGVFLMFAGLYDIAESTKQSDELLNFSLTNISFLACGSGLTISSYCLYNYIGSNPEVVNITSLLGSLINSRQRGEEKNATTRQPKIKKQPDPMVKKIIQGEQKRQKNKRKWFGLLMPVIQKISALMHGSLVKKGQSDEIAVFPIKNTDLEEKGLEQRPSIEESKPDKPHKSQQKKKNKPTKKNSEEKLEDSVAAMRSETTSFEPTFGSALAQSGKTETLSVENTYPGKIKKQHLLSEEIKPDKPHKPKKNPRELAALGNLEDSIATRPAETKSFEPVSAEEDDQKTQQEKDAAESQEALTRLIRREQQFSTETAKGFQLELVSYVGQQNSMLRSSLPPSLPLYRLSESPQSLLPSPRKRLQGGKAESEYGRSTTLAQR